MRAVDVLKTMPIEELRRRIHESRGLTPAEVEARQRVWRLIRAKAAAEALRAESTNR